jgi:hypothetical protein
MCLYLRGLNVQRKSEKIFGFGVHEYEIQMIHCAQKLEYIRISGERYRMI